MSSEIIPNLSKKDSKKINKAFIKVSKLTYIALCDKSTDVLIVVNGGLKNDVQKTELETSLSAYSNQIIDILTNPLECFAIICCKDSFSAEIIRKSCIINVSTPNIKLRPVAVCYLFYIENIPQNFINVPETLNKLPQGLIIQDDFITDSEQKDIWNFVINEAIKDPENLKQRCVFHYGYKFDYNTNGSHIDKPLLDKPIPNIFLVVLKRLNRDIKFNQCTVNIYEPGDGIPSHTDTHSMFQHEIVSLSIGGAIVMDWLNPRTSERVSIELKPGTVCIMTGESRFLWKHAIPARKFDVVKRLRSNENSIEYVKQKREKRISLTFRALKIPPECANCSYKESCDIMHEEKLPNEYDSASNLSKPHNAAQLESFYVHSVYSEIATHFSATRHSMWPRVRDFIQSQFTDQSRTLIAADFGCGNGKYLTAPRLNNNNNNCIWLASDPCKQFCEMAATKASLGNFIDPIIMSILQIPYRSELCDFWINIAVLHHLCTSKRRLKALRNMCGMLRRGGKGLIYVWALQQNQNQQKSHYISSTKNKKDEATTKKDIVKLDTCLGELEVHKNRTEFKSADMLVPWTKKQDGEDGQKEDKFVRYYHLFEEGELEKMCAEIDNVRVCDRWYDSGNWAVVVEKL